MNFIYNIIFLEILILFCFQLLNISEHVGYREMCFCIVGVICTIFFNAFIGFGVTFCIYEQNLKFFV